jgi:acetolactate synthase-1/2/3 large subunit
MIAKGPCLLEIMTDIDEIVYPIVRPGGSYAEMDLGPYIKEIDLNQNGRIVA